MTEAVFAAEPSRLSIVAMVCAINGGATAFSHVNDSGFWLVSSLLEIDEKTTLKSWTMMETIIGVTGLICAIVISLFAQRRTEIRGIPSLPDKLVNRKDAAIRQHNEELENLKEQYEGLDICDEDKKVIDNYIACKDARAERMAEKLYEKGMKDVKRRIRIRKLIRRCVVLAAIVGVVLVEYDKNDKRWEKLDRILKMFADAEDSETEEA